MASTVGGADFVIEFVEGVAKLRQHLMTSGRESIDPRGLCSFRFRRAEPTASRHPSEDGIQSPRTQPIAVVVQFFEHPLPVDAAAVGRVMEDVNLPER